MTMPRCMGVAIALACGLSAGCLHGPSEIKADLSQAAGVELDQEFGLTLGRVGTWFAKQGVKIANKHSDEDIPVSLKGVRKISVGVYEVEGLRRGFDEPRGLRLDDLDLGPAWHPLVQVHDADGDVFVMLRETDGKIRSLLVVVAEDDEWVLVRIRGNLNRVVEDALRFGFDAADRSDRYADTRRERGLDDDDDEEDSRDEWIDCDSAS